MRALADALEAEADAHDGAFASNRRRAAAALRGPLYILSTADPREGPESMISSLHLSADAVRVSLQEAEWWGPPAEAALGAAEVHGDGCALTGDGMWLCITRTPGPAAL